MDRREWLNVLGVGGAGLAAGGVCSADDHQTAGAGSKYMAATAEFHHHFCGIHVAKNNKDFQIIAQHYCMLGEKVHQCLLFDSHEKGAKLLGVEYIVPNELFQKLPEEEKKYWHPHAYEVMGGGLIAPGMSKEDEDKFMGIIMYTWGKTWHTWPDPKTEVPMGNPLLMWSLGGDDQVKPEIVAQRDKVYGVNTAKIREERAKTFGFEIPSIPFPKSESEIGRRWTTSGPDEPKKK